MQEEKFIIQYNLADFVFDIVKAVKEGYEPSVKNEHYPTSMGIGIYQCGMVKELPTKKQEEFCKNADNLDLSAVYEVPKVGRPKKVNQ